MRARTSFTLLIALASLTAVAFFSIHTSIELREEVYEVIDMELGRTAEAIFQRLNTAASAHPLDSADVFLSGYWLRVNGQSGEPLFATPLAQAVDIPPPDPKKASKAYLVSLPIDRKLLQIPNFAGEDLGPGPIELRARMFVRQLGAEQVTVHIAKPMHLITREVSEILRETWSSIILTILVIMALSYLVAGRILLPLAEINRRVTRIREQSLHERLPLRRSRDEFHALICALNSMFDRLEHSFARQREFIGNAAHEMKSPLTILILGHEELLASDLDPEVRLALERQLQTMQRLNKLIRDLLSIARLEQEDTLTREQVDLAGLIARILEDYQEILAARDITVELQLCPLLIPVDREKIQRLLINLIDNGIKYNLDKSGVLIIQAKIQQKNAIIEITNSGCTIPPQDLGQVFKQFYRVEKSRAAAFGGTGLGLTIALRIARMHGGELTVASKGNRTTFTLKLPIALEPQ